MDFQQSRTYNNIVSSYEGELMSSTEYQIYADRARQDGFVEIGNIFDTAARNQKEHARIWLRRLNNGIVPPTANNLLAASELEGRIGSETYREYARIALEEGYDDISALFSGIANIELNHSLTFRTAYENVIRDEVFCKPRQSLWICMQCGNIMSGNCAPEICPVCGFPQGYYRLYQAEEV